MMKYLLLFLLVFSSGVVAEGIAIEIKNEIPQLFLFKDHTFFIAISNKNKCPVKELSISTLIPQEMDYIRSSPSALYSRAKKKNKKNNVVWRLAHLAPKTTAVFQLKLRAKLVSRCHLEIKCVGKVEKLTLTKHVMSKPFRISGVGHRLGMVYDTDDPIAIGEQTTYVIDLVNEGTGICTGLLVVNTIPKEMRFVSASGPSKYTVKGQEVHFVPIAKLKPFEKLVYKITCQAISEGNAKNEVRFTYDQFEKPIVDEEGTSIYR